MKGFPEDQVEAENRRLNQAKETLKAQKAKLETQLKASRDAVVGVETKWWEEVRPEKPQFVITVFNKGDYEFTVTKVILSGIEVWAGEFTVKPHSKGKLEISDISEVFDRH